MPQPLSLIAIDIDNVGRPRNDGTPGSGLYAVPIKLSRTASAREAELLVYFWDNPNTWSSMHRGGIARVVGDTIILDGTTIEEVRDVHITTLRGIVAWTNEAREKEVEVEERQGAAESTRVHNHEANVRKSAGEIRFD